MAEIIGAEQAVNRAAGRVREVEMWMQVYPETERPAPGEDLDDFRLRQGEADQRRAEGERQMRATLRAAGQASAVAAYAAHIDRPTDADFQTALIDARRDLGRAEDNVRQLRQEQGIMGSRSGSLRQTLQQSATWLRANGYGHLATEIEP
jgi:hypothetical protein